MDTTIGETHKPIEYLVDKNKPFTIPDKLEGKYQFVLQSVSLVKRTKPEEFYCACVPNKPFVPSFDDKQPDTQIVMWASRDNPDEAKVKVRGSVNTQTGVIDITGSGFEYVIIHAYLLDSSDKEE